MSFSLASTQRSIGAARQATRPARKLTVVNYTANDPNAPANVLEARKWIAEWKLRSERASVAGVAHPPAHHQHPATPKTGSHAPTKVYPDGTMLFTAEQLKQSKK